MDAQDDVSAAGPAPGRGDTTEDLQQQVDTLQRTLDSVTAQLSRLDRELGQLRETPPPGVTAVAATAVTVAPGDGPGGVSRRGMLLGVVGAAAAVGTAGVLAAPAPAGATNGDTMKVGVYTNQASAPTELVYNSGTILQPNYFGFGVVDQSAPNGIFDSTPALGAVANSKNFATAIQAVATNDATGIVAKCEDGHALNASATGTGVGIYSQTEDGPALYAGSANAPAVAGHSIHDIGVAASSSTSTGLTAESDAATAASFTSTHALILLNGTNRQQPSLDSQAHLVGELVEDGTGSLWLCVKGGTPGTWRKLAGPTSAGAFHVLKAPVRVYDSRPGFAPTGVGTKTPIAAGTSRVIDLTQNSSGVPGTATAAVVNLLVLNAATGNGNLTLWANGVAQPTSNAMVWGGSAGRFSSLGLTALGTGKCQVATSIKIDIAIDVVGYYL